MSKVFKNKKYGKILLQRSWNKMIMINMSSSYHLSMQVKCCKIPTIFGKQIMLVKFEALLTKFRQFWKKCIPEENDKYDTW